LLLLPTFRQSPTVASVVEPVEASKRSQEKANKGGGFDASIGSATTDPSTEDTP